MWAAVTTSATKESAMVHMRRLRVEWQLSTLAPVIVVAGRIGAVRVDACAECSRRCAPSPPARAQAHSSARHVLPPQRPSQRRATPPPHRNDVDRMRIYAIHTTAELMEVGQDGGVIVDRGSATKWKRRLADDAGRAAATRHATPLSRRDTQRLRRTTVRSYASFFALSLSLRCCVRLLRAADAAGWLAVWRCLAAGWPSRRRNETAGPLTRPATRRRPRGGEAGGRVRGEEGRGNRSTHLTSARSCRRLLSLLQPPPSPLAVRLSAAVRLLFSPGLSL